MIHRADYHTLLRLAHTAPCVHIHLGVTAHSVQPDPSVKVKGGSSVMLASGEVIYADLIITADGVKSAIQG